MDWLTLLVPFAYLGILLTSLATFSSLYRKRKTKKFLSLAPYFPPHTPRNVYLSLLHMQDHDPSSPKVPESVLRAALLARCTEDIHRIIHVRTRKQALNTLLKKGCVGDEIWERLMRAERELEAEVKDCVIEANAYSPSWGSTIFQSANEMANNDMLKKRLESITSSLPREKAAWEARLESNRQGFMRELDEKSAGNSNSNSGGGGGKGTKSPAASAIATVNAAAASAAAAAAAAASALTTGVSGTETSIKANQAGSDEDAVLVEKGGGEVMEGDGMGVGGAAKGRKKKGKK